LPPDLIFDKNYSKYTYLSETQHKFTLMNNKISIIHDFQAVFLVNGRFSESNSLIVDSDQVLFLTVLPLEPLHLSYTLKIVDSKVLLGEPFGKIYRCGDELLLHLLPRFSYVYTTEPHQPPADTPKLLFECVKSGELSSARELLTAELSVNIDDEALREFFAPYEEAISCGGKYYLTASDQAEEYYFVLKQGKIDDIIAKE